MKTLEQIMQDIAEPTPDWAIKWLDDNQGGEPIPYIPWYNIVSLLNERAGFGAWQSNVRGDVWVSPALRGSKSAGYEPTDLAHVVVEITINGSDGTLVFSNIGSDDQPTGQRGVPEERAMASGMRRTFATMGGGLDLYGRAKQGGGDSGTRQQGGGGGGGGGQQQYNSAPPSKRVDVPTDGCPVEGALKAELSSAKWPSDVKKVIQDYVKSGEQVSELGIEVIAAEVVYRLTRTMKRAGLNTIVECIQEMGKAGYPIGADSSIEPRDVGVRTAYTEAKARVDQSGQ